MKTIKHKDLSCAQKNRLLSKHQVRNVDTLTGKVNNIFMKTNYIFHKIPKIC